jgi:acetylornithine deacetylase/succinyl-diaminopimelate desuccinylase-like protein
VVPSVATATVDGRMLPGHEQSVLDEIARLLGPDVEREWDSLPPVRTSFDGPLVDAMAAAVGAEDPGARLLPYMMSAGTDAKPFDRLGVRHLGFAPLRLPPELDFTALFHGVDERVPTDALEFGTRVLDRLLRTC